MQYQLRKEILEPHYMAGYGRLEYCAMYKVWQEEKKIGQFFISDEVAFYAYDDEDVRIDYVRRAFRRTLYPIIDQKTQQPFGGYDRQHYSSSWTPYGKLFLGDAVYRTKKAGSCKLGSRPQIDNLDVWMGNLEQSVHFDVRITRPQPWYKRPRLYKGELEGTVTLHGDSLRLLFCSLFLLEQVIEFEDDTSGG
ncbi:hypothetical protein [Paraflavitalea pollutisoli]|uniref:hypothetical protein n=1 Tax=Paraflavitalea pollutisoli TaxID=3034143 RepID=UPI0023EAD56D|nr:hypothetical protein [Paraflavitalea sp. H1-2-19X]